jgi:hypothetical protein
MNPNQPSSPDKDTETRKEKAWHGNAWLKGAKGFEAGRKRDEGMQKD